MNVSAVSLGVVIALGCGVSGLRSQPSASVGASQRTAECAWIAQVDALVERSEAEYERVLEELAALRTAELTRRVEQRGRCAAYLQLTTARLHARYSRWPKASASGEAALSGFRDAGLAPDAVLGLLGDATLATGNVDRADEVLRELVTRLLDRPEAFAELSCRLAQWSLCAAAKQEHDRESALLDEALGIAEAAPRTEVASVYRLAAAYWRRHGDPERARAVLKLALGRAKSKTRGKLRALAGGIPPGARKVVPVPQPPMPGTVADDPVRQRYLEAKAAYDREYARYELDLRIGDQLAGRSVVMGGFPGDMAPVGIDPGIQIEFAEARQAYMTHLGRW